MQQKYDFEKDLEQDRMSVNVINARRFAHAIRMAMREIDCAAAGYCLKNKEYYRDTKAFLEEMITRLEAGSDPPLY